MRFRNFDKEFEKSERRFNFIFRAVSTLIGVSFVAIIAAWIFQGVIAYKTFNYVSENGLKTVIERVWEGDKR